MIACALALMIMFMGCTRKYYRNFADRDVYRIEQERQFDWRWTTPPRPVEADPRSRMGDVHNPNQEPIPLDEPASRPFQVSAGRPFEFLGWEKRGTAPVEDLSWRENLPKDSDGTVKLDAASAMRIGLMNSRDYQSTVEDVYLQALSLTFTRFSFFPQLFANQSTGYRQFGATKNASSQLQMVTGQALNWSFYSGATMAVNFANALVFEYNGKGFQTVNSGLGISLVQPLLRGAWARNVTQPLSVAERQMLYAIRNFATFRRNYYYNTVSGYLALLVQVQQIRNQESVVQQFKQNLSEYEALVQANIINAVQRDTIANQYLQARQTLLSQEAQLQTSLDLYRITQLGLPADFPMTIDAAPLKQFELSDSRLDTLRRDNDALFLSMLQYDKPPGREVIAKTARKVQAEFKQLSEVSKGVAKEMAKWQARIAAEKGKVGTGPGPLEEDEKESLKSQEKLAKELAEGLGMARRVLADNLENMAEFIEKLDQTPMLFPFGLEPIIPLGATIEKVGPTNAEDAWRDLQQNIVGRDFKARLSEQFVVETQVRVYLIELNRVEMTVPQAISTALENRLDLMNSLGNVTDGWRNVEAAGNQLLAGVNLFYQGNLNTAPNKLGLAAFDAHNSLHLAGIRFDAPIVRRQERNTYRADQIQFQRARRAYMLNHDVIVRTIRLDMRLLNLNRRQFEIGRQQLLVAARQVDQAEYNARTGNAADTGGQSASLYLLTALNNLLTAKNGLIDNWVTYEVQRIGLYRDFDLMNIDAQGVWTNDNDIPTANGGDGPAAASADPVGAASEPLLPPPAPDGDGAFNRP